MKTSFRTRRKKQLQVEKTYKLITFRLRELWFALPLEKVLKVIITEQIYQHPTQTEIKLTTYQNQEIVLIDIDDYIFNKKKLDSKQEIKNKHVLLFDNQRNEKTINGLLIDSAPRMLEVKESAFQTLPKNHQQIDNIQSISSQIVQLENHRVYFILIPEKMSLISNK